MTEVQAHGALSSSELAELTEWLSGQFSDGWGEGLEQREIKVDDGELCVSFWDSSDRFFIKPKDKLKGSQSSGFGMTIKRLQQFLKEQEVQPCRRYRLLNR